MSALNAIKISENIYWVGAIDWELRNFHGYATSQGSTYNAFLIMGEKPILIDAVKEAFCDEMLARIASVIEPQKIKYIISNHAEMDHSGSLPRVINLINPEKVFATKVGAQALQDHFHLQYNFTEVQDGEELSLGNITLKFFETKMLHWPESMFTFCVNDGVLFSQDGFAAHYATSELFAENNNFCLLSREAAKYFANILLPYSSFVTKAVTRLQDLKLNLKMIAPDHGPLWREPEQIDWIIKHWYQWSLQEHRAKAVIIFDTMWKSTAKMASAIADGLTANSIEAKVINLSVNSRSDVITEILDAGALLVGSPTLNQQIFPSVADNLCYIKGLKPKNLVGQVFGSYGWADAATKILTAELQSLGVELVGEPVQSRYVPTAATLEKCHNLGAQIASALKNKIGSK
jgi:flavorubredoxin